MDLRGDTAFCQVCVLTVFAHVLVYVSTSVHGRNSEAMPEPSEGVGPAGISGLGSPVLWWKQGTGQSSADTGCSRHAEQSRPRLPPPELSSTKGYMQDLADNSLSFGVNEKQYRLSYRLPLVVILVFSMQIDCSLYIKCQTFPQV